MFDRVEIIGNGSLIQHGKQNNRVYLMKLNEHDVHDVLSEINMLAKTNNYSKIVCKVPKHIAPIFYADGFILEAYIPRFYHHETDAFFVSKFLNRTRFECGDKSPCIGLSELLKNKPSIANTNHGSNSEYHIRKLNTSDVSQIVDIYTEVFESYPFPIFNKEYIIQTMDEDVQYFGAEKDGKLAALSSAEIDFKSNNAEMTDFATLPAHAGNHLSQLLLKTMEQEMKAQSVSTLYTIARLVSIPMNKTFIKEGYQYTGTLINNTNIGGKIESMNVLYKYV